MESLLPFLLFFVFIALRLLGGRKKASPRLEAGDAGEPDMDEALRQIRQALGMPDDRPRVERPLPPAVLPPRPVAPPPAAVPPAPSPRPTHPAGTRYSSERFAGPSPLAPRAASSPAAAPPPPPAPPAVFLSGAEARRAILLAEILGPPRSQRPLRRQD